MTLHRKPSNPFPLNRQKCQASIKFSLSFFLSAQKVKEFFIMVEHLPLSLCLSALSVSHRKDICLILVPFIQIVLPLPLYKHKDHSFVKWMNMNFFFFHQYNFQEFHVNLGSNIKVMLEMVNQLPPEKESSTFRKLSVRTLSFLQNIRKFGQIVNYCINKKLLQK